MDINGIIVIDKPQNMTSHDVVAILRRNLKMKRIGHTGTLDPMATGVLPICLGKSTKLVDYLVDTQKVYRGTLTLGSATDTQDTWGKIIEESSKVVSSEEIKEAVMSYIGEINQVPPMYSALKVDGKKLVDLAREGIVVERKSRKITIHDIEILSIDFPNVDMIIKCSKGTYIRTLCHDIGEKLGTFGHMSKLNRIETGGFFIDQAIAIEDASAENILKKLVSIDDAISFYKKIDIPVKFKKQILNGVKIDLSDFVIDDERYGEIYPYINYSVYLNGEFVGIAEFNESKKTITIKKLMVG